VGDSSGHPLSSHRYVKYSASTILDGFGVKRGHVAIQNWVDKAELQPSSTVRTAQFAVDENVIRINGNAYWLHGAVDPETHNILQCRLFPATTTQTTQ
jgi:transposase-like protein